MREQHSAEYLPAVRRGAPAAVPAAGHRAPAAGQVHILGRPAPPGLQHTRQLGADMAGNAIYYSF